MTNDIHVVPHKDGWCTKKDGSQRSCVVTETQKAAIDCTRGQGQREHVEALILRKDGTIRYSESYGTDPNLFERQEVLDRTATSAPLTP